MTTATIVATPNKRAVTSRSHGRNTLEIECPFCGSVAATTEWSFFGCGKKCECGAKHTYLGSYPPCSKCRRRHATERVADGAHLCKKCSQ